MRVEQTGVVTGRMRGRTRCAALTICALPVFAVAGCGNVQDVTLHVAAPGLIHDNPGGVGPATAAQDIPVLLDPTVYRGRIQVTSVSVLPGAHVVKGQKLLTLDPVALKINAVVVQQQLATAQGQIAAAQQTQKHGQAAGASLGSITQQISAFQAAVAQDNSNISQLQTQVNAPQPTPNPNGLSPTAAEIQAQHQALVDQLASAQQQLFRDQAALAASQGQYQSTSADVFAATQGGNTSINALTALVSLDQQLLDIANGASPSIASPIDGDVAAVSISAGQAAAPGVPLVQIIDSSKLRVTARFPISEKQYVIIGAPAHLTFSAVPGNSLTGSVVSISPVTTDGLTFQAIVDADNGGNRIFPGLVANVSVEAARSVPVAVPRICVLNLDQDPQAFVVDDANVAHLRTLHIGRADADRVEIVSGITKGERCVVAGNQSLRDGVTVHVSKVEG